MTSDEQRETEAPQYAHGLHVHNMAVEAYRKPGEKWHVVIIDRSDKEDKKLDITSDQAGALSLSIRELLYQLNCKG